LIACIGETLQERESGKTNEVVENQAQKVHEHLRKFIEKNTNVDIAKKMRIIYDSRIVSK
jgi:triosephosphate isomerase